MPKSRSPESGSRARKTGAPAPLPLKSAHMYSRRANKEHANLQHLGGTNPHDQSATLSFPTTRSARRSRHRMGIQPHQSLKSRLPRRLLAGPRQRSVSERSSCARYHGACCGRPDWMRDAGADVFYSRRGLPRRPGHAHGLQFHPARRGVRKKAVGLIYRKLPPIRKQKI